MHGLVFAWQLYNSDVLSNCNQSVVNFLNLVYIRLLSSVYISCCVFQLLIVVICSKKNRQ